MDSELFEAAFVTCSQAKFRALFTEDAEFYHDRAGPSFGDAARTLRSCPRDNGVTRTLVPGSLEVYPMQGYGAIQIGRHVFARAGEPGSETAKFVHLWKREGDTWRLTRVLSFDHRPSQTVRIGSAIYSVQDRTVPCDVTTKVASICNGLAACTVQAQSALCPMGDPAPRRQKILTVEYTCGTARMPQAEALEGKTLSLTCPQ